MAWAFRPLARLPYPWAFAVWLVISLTLYLFGLVLTLRGLNLSPADRLTALLLALSFEPFVMETWLGGQLSAVGFCCLAGCVALDRQGRPFAAGLVLGLCGYKPTLLVVLFPVLLAARRFRTLAGLAVTGLALAGLTCAAVGWEGITAFVERVTGFTRHRDGAGPLELPLTKFIDLNAFTRLLLGSSLAPAPGLRRPGPAPAGLAAAGGPGEPARPMRRPPGCCGPPPCSPRPSSTSTSASTTACIAVPGALLLVECRIGAPRSFPALRTACWPSTSLPGSPSRWPVWPMCSSFTLVSSR